ncbi:SRPBCC family protein [Calidifontibacter indicus]|uniref:Polyketide cyclase/dehydrase/lipid transport protein n=1 Tax=Calidifontibacter indicus TaxID=419650 RepID=A0A3D9UQS0_9MICO|nr:SRPBCC family protein [Calidifontibacter indicus]REF30843.1 polyketide cyclase/dehydrase/lipid transport protein [Calidifontibacter indicus]
MDTLQVRHTTSASPEAVWDVLADGWRYPCWVVGASRMRAVERGFPAAGTKLHHSVGSWPLLLDDDTEVLESQPARLLRIRAKTRPFGTAVVTLTLEPAADGGTTITMAEDADSGPIKAVPMVARQAAITPRNRESMLRLALLAERADQP